MYFYIKWAQRREISILIFFYSFLMQFLVKWSSYCYKGTQIQEFHIFGRHIEFLYFINYDGFLVVHFCI